MCLIANQLTMKQFLIIACIVISITSYGQTKEPKGREHILQNDSTVRANYETLKDVHINLSVFGDFEIAECIKIGNTQLNPIELNLLIGSLVRIQQNSITGQEINPMTFQIYEKEHMSRDDFIYRTTGKVPDTTISQLPETINVHKTDHSACYGIIYLGIGKVAIPYKGNILILERRK